MQVSRFVIWTVIRTLGGEPSMVFCYRCHAQDAVGSTFAPNLLDRIQGFDFDAFVDRTANGFTGQVGVMPPWKDNPNVSKRYKELFAYLKARSDGALPRGRPKKKP